MSFVSRKSILLQLQEDSSWNRLSVEDKRLVHAFHDAILSVQRPTWFGRVPVKLRKAALAWFTSKTRKHRASPEFIGSQLRFADALGLKRTRGSRSDSPTAYEWV